VISTAQGDASRFRAILAEYERAPQVTRERMYLDTMQQILSATSKVIVDQKGGQNLLYLPLDRLIQRRRSAGPPSPSTRRAPRRRSRPRRAGTVAHAPRQPALARPGGRTMKRASAYVRHRRHRRGARRRDERVHHRPAQGRHQVPAGRGEGDPDRPGLYFLVPLLQNVRLFDTRIQTLEARDPERFLTAENRNVLVDSFVKWRVVDVRQYYVSVRGDPILAESRISQTVNDALRAEFARKSVHDVVSATASRSCSTW
jgi:regulator of protease activity HflC (stomatin/prohibitin superfamily)